MTLIWSYDSYVMVLIERRMLKPTICRRRQLHLEIHTLRYLKYKAQLYLRVLYHFGRMVI